MTEQQIKDSVRVMNALERELYFEHLEIAKGELGVSVNDRSLEAANIAHVRVVRNRATCRAKGWIV